LITLLKIQLIIITKLPKKTTPKTDVGVA